MSQSTNQLPKDKKGITVLRAGAKTVAMSLAHSVVFSLKSSEEVHIEYFGAGAGNTVTKAVAIARGEGSKSGLDIWSYPIFRDLNDKTLTDGNGEQLKTGMTVVVKSINKN